MKPCACGGKLYRWKYHPSGRLHLHCKRCGKNETVDARAVPMLQRGRVGRAGYDDRPQA